MSPDSAPAMQKGKASHHRRTAWWDRTPATTIAASSGMGAPRPPVKRTRNSPAYRRFSTNASTRSHLGKIRLAEDGDQCILLLFPCGQKEPCHGGETLRRRSFIFHLQRASARGLRGGRQRRIRERRDRPG